jgi:hemolysin III
MAVDRSQGYSRAERVSDATIHVLGVSTALVGVLVLIPLAIFWSGEVLVVVGAAIYAAALLVMLGASAFYHMTPREDWKPILRRLDHSAIYIKIAGTYTPFMMLSGVGPGLLLICLWVAAFFGAGLRILAPNRFVWLGLALYLAMGWSGVLVGAEMVSGLSPTAFMLMIFGGVIYTVGVAFFLWEGLRFHNTIWHGFVLVATAFFYAALVIELAGPGLSPILKS